MPPVDGWGLHRCGESDGRLARLMLNVLADRDRGGLCPVGGEFLALAWKSAESLRRSPKKSQILRSLSNSVGVGVPPSSRPKRARMEASTRSDLARRPRASVQRRECNGLIAVHAKRESNRRWCKRRC